MIELQFTEAFSYNYLKGGGGDTHTLQLENLYSKWHLALLGSSDFIYPR